MVKANYQVVAESAKIAKAMMKNKPVSLKYSLEIIATIKGKPVEKAMAWLSRISRMEQPLHLRTYQKKVGHRKGQALNYSKAGRYPIRCVNAFIELLNAVKANADYKGMDSDNLLITHMFASQGFSRMSYQSQGRISGKARKSKSTHIEVIVREAA